MIFPKGFMIQRLFTFSRRLVIVAVVCSLIASMLVLLTGTVETLDVLYTLASDWSKLSGKKVMVPLVEVTDLFLVGTVFYIVALGLYELFVDSRLRIPPWLEIRSVDELKTRLAGVVVVVLGVSFLGETVKGIKSLDLLLSGGASALVIVALTYFLGNHTHNDRTTHDGEITGAHSPEATDKSYDI